MSVKFVNLDIWPTWSEDEVFNDPWTDIADEEGKK